VINASFIGGLAVPFGLAVVSVVPEPSAWPMIAVGGVALLGILQIYRTKLRLVGIAKLTRPKRDRSNTGTLQIKSDTGRKGSKGIEQDDHGPNSKRCIRDAHSVAPSLTFPSYLSCPFFLPTCPFFPLLDLVGLRCGLAAQLQGRSAGHAASGTETALLR